jgi:hypothetical protein
VLARALEAGGIATTSISLIREHTEKIKPPRALFVPFPFGLALGPPGDVDLQHRVLAAALDLLSVPAGPVLCDFPEDSAPDTEPLAPVLDAVVKFLKAFADGGDADLPERPREVPLPGFVRYAADDVKALYYEAFMADTPSASGVQIARWFWGETAAGQLLRRVRERLDASDDPAWKAAAFGVAR